VGGHKGPRVDGEGPGLHQGGEAGHEVFSVRLLPEDGPALDPPHHHGVEDAGRIQSRTARHRQAAPLLGRCEQCVGLQVMGIIHQSNLSSNVPFSMVAAMTLGCSQPSGPAAVIEDKVYTVTPASMTVKAGIVTGEVTEMKVTERVEKGSGRLVSPAKLTGKLVLKNSSTNQAVRLITGKILYIDVQGQPIKLEEARTEPTIKFATYGAETLDPGKDATQSLNVDFPAEALKAKKLKEIRLELAYIPSPYKEETINFTVAIGGQ